MFTRNIFILIVFIISPVMMIQAQVDSFKITSDISGMSAKYFNITKWRGNSKSISKNKIEVVNEEIFYQDTTSVPLIIRLTLDEEKLFKRIGKGYIPVKSQSIWMVVSPGDNILLNGHLSDFAEVYPQSGKENMVLNKLITDYHPLLNQIVNIDLEMRLYKEKFNESKIDEKNKSLQALTVRADSLMAAFISENVSSIAGLYYLNDSFAREIVSAEQVEKWILKVDEKYRKTGFYHELTQRLSGSKYYEGAKMVKIISNQTPTREEFNNTKYQGKFYLIDFWGSWCRPCLQDIPHIKKLREKLGSNLEVLGIASDRVDKWKEAIEKFDLNWDHILIGDGDDDFASKFNIRAYPTKILVSPDGIILYRSTGSGEDTFHEIEKCIFDYFNNASKGK